jgi:hypothetical protein
MQKQGKDRLMFKNFQTGQTAGRKKFNYVVLLKIDELVTILFQFLTQKCLH